MMEIREVGIVFIHFNNQSPLITSFLLSNNGNIVYGYGINWFQFFKEIDSSNSTELTEKVKKNLYR